MKILKENKGITLVALVITIIVLLILAGVTLSLVLGENGIIPRAEQSKEETIKAQVKEEIERKILEYKTVHDGEFNLEEFFEDDNLLEGFIKNTEEYSLTNNDYTFYINEDGKVREKEYELPDGYIECEYLESTGTQYINTGIYGINTIRFQIDFKVIDTSKFAQNGKNNTNSGNNRVNIGKANSGAWYWGFGDENITKDIADTNRHKMGIDIPNLKYWVDDTVYTKSSYTHSNNNPRLIYLFAVNSKSSIQDYSYEKLYSSQIYESGILVRNFIPCLDSNGIPCMYDTVSKQTFYNSGTGTFKYELK